VKRSARAGTIVRDAQGTMITRIREKSRKSIIKKVKNTINDKGEIVLFTIKNNNNNERFHPISYFISFSAHNYHHLYYYPYVLFRQGRQQKKQEAESKFQKNI
jgi:hypothetical protein